MWPSLWKFLLTCTKITSKFQKALPAEVIASKFDFIKDMDDETTQQCDLFVKGLQFNVQTLRSHVKRKAFLTIFKHNGYAFACLQETRSNKTCIKVVDDVIMCSSAGADGNHGCEVFINSKSPWARVHDKPVSICRNDVCIMFADHRSIIVCISNKHLHMYIISAHAPYVGCHEDPTTWWKIFQRNVLKFCKVGAPVVLGIDANYQSHVSMSSGMGDLNILNCSPPPNHEAVIDCISNCGFKVANTSQELCSPAYCSDPHTYVCTNSHVDKVTRIDYFMFNSSCFCKTHSVCSEKSFGFEDSDKDHVPIAAVFSFSCAKGTASIKRRILPYDPLKFNDPSSRAAFTNLLSDFPPVPVCVDNTSHCHINDTNVVFALGECFPKDKHPPKTPYTSKQTMSAILSAAHDRRNMFKLRASFNKTCVWAAFGIWSNKTWRAKWNPVWGFSSSKRLSLWFLSREAFRLSSAHAKSLLFKDKTEYFGALGKEIVDSFNSDSMKRMYKALNDLFRVCKSGKKVQKCSGVSNEDGLPACNTIEEKYVFRNHFSDLLGGETSTFETLVHSDRKCSSDRFEGVSPECLSTCIPTIPDLILSNNKNTRNKGFGESLICTNVLKDFPIDYAILTYPLVLKSFVRIQPPLQWKGGVLVELFKGKGSPSLCGNYRDILLADDQGKGISRIIRKRFMKLAMNLSHDTQYGGGLNGGETAFAQLYVRLVIDYAVNSSTSCSTLYLDVVAAFATMLRRVIFDSDSGDEAWLASLAKAGRLLQGRY